MSEKLAPLEEGLLKAMRAIDNQIAREMQRTPAERDLHGVNKTKPYDDRLERVATFILDSLGENQICLDSLLVLSRAMVKVLRLVSEDLGEEGLGEVRTEYCFRAFDEILGEAEKGRRSLRQELN